MELKNRLQYVADNYFRGNLRSLSSESGVAYTTLYEYVSGKKMNITTSIVLQIHKVAPKVSLIWLAFGIGEIILGEGISEILVNESGPFYGKSLFNADKFLICQTQSMAPYIMLGDRLALVNADVNSIIYGRAYLIKSNGQELVSYIFPADNDHVLLKHENPKFPEYSIEISRIDALYLAVGLSGQR